MKNQLTPIEEHKRKMNILTISLSISSLILVSIITIILSK